MTDETRALTLANDLDTFYTELVTILKASHISIHDDGRSSVEADDLDGAEIGLHTFRKTLVEWPFYELYREELAPTLAWANAMLEWIDLCQKRQCLIDSAKALATAPKLQPEA